MTRFKVKRPGDSPIVEFWLNEHCGEVILRASALGSTQCHDILRITESGALCRISMIKEDAKELGIATDPEGRILVQKRTAPARAKKEVMPSGH